MKTYLSLSLLALAMLTLQGCESYVYGPVYPEPGYPVVVYPGHPGYYPGRPIWHRGHGRWDAMVTDSKTLISQNYGVSLASAEKISNLAQGVNTVETLSDMGVSAQDLACLQNSEMPSQDTIAKIASNLGEDQAKINQIFADFVADTKADSN